jgi:hypothetical protein
MGAAEIRSRLVSRRLGQAECNDEGDDEGDDAATAAAPPPIADRTKGADLAWLSKTTWNSGQDLGRAVS